MIPPRRMQWLAALVCCAAFGYIAAVLPAHGGFPLDDSWIHETVAQNLAETGVLGYYRGIHGSGSSSLLWTAILWLKWKLPQGVSPVAYCAVVSGLLLGGCGWLLKRLVDEDGVDTAEGWILALAPALNGNFVWFGLLGMEHVLFVFLSLVVIAGFFSRRAWGVRGAAVAAGLLALTRPEGVLLAGMLLLLRQAARRTWREYAVLVSGAAIGELISMRVNWISTHTLLPLTMKGRQFLFLETTDVFRMKRGPLIWSWLRGIMKAWNVYPYAHGNPGLEILGVVSLGGLVFLVIEIGGLLRERRWRMIAFVGWAIALDLVYLAILPTIGHGGRYQSIHVLLLLPLMFAGLYRCLKWLTHRVHVPAGRRLAWMTIAVVMVISTATSLHTWREVATDGIDQINQEHGAMAEWLERNLPDEASGHMAVFDIGRIGYDIHGQLVDLGGLTDPAYLPYLFSDKVTDYLQAHSMEYLVLPANPGGDPEKSLKRVFRNGRRPVMRELKTICFDSVYTPGVYTYKLYLVGSATQAAMPCQSVYRLSY